jgi:BspA type Leucine rich repeat region (6 copies)/PKD domain
MKTKRTFLLIGCVGGMLLFAVVLQSRSQTIQNPDFATPSVYDSGNNYYSWEFAPAGASWSFTGNSGIAANGSGYVYFSPPDPIPNGNPQCAFLQSISGSSASISQTLTFPAANDFTITFYSSQRDVDTRDNTQNQPLFVQVDGQLVFYAVPPVGWQSYNTAPIFLAAGTHTLNFACAEVTGNATVLFDQVGVVPALTWITNNTITITGYNYPGGAITIPDTIDGMPVTSIATEAFAGDSLTSVTIGTNVTSIGQAAFADCTSLTSISVNPANPAYSSVNGVLFDEAQDTLIQYPAGQESSGYTIPSSVTSIGVHAFYGCFSLVNVTIPGSVTSIAGYAFVGCTSLANVAIPNGVNYVGDLTFYECYDLTNVIIPDSVTGIGESAFYDCTSLSSVTIPGSVTTIGPGTFSYCSSLTAVYFVGNAPFVDPDIFESSPVTVYDLPASTGWPNFTSETGLTPQLWPVGVQISANPANAPVNTAIQFYCPSGDDNGNTITNWAWNFGDDATSTGQNPSHIYTVAGTYAPYLIAGNNIGRFDAGYGLAITVFPPAPPLGVSPYGGQPAVFFPTATGTNYVLQMSTNLASGNWVTVSNGISISGLIITNPPASAFFRLQSP